MLAHVWTLVGSEKEIKNGQIWKFQQNMLLNRQLLVKFCERNIFLTTSIGTKLLLFSFLNLMSSKVSLGYFGSRVSTVANCSSPLGSEVQPGKKFTS